jgi:hypothetical protein
MHKSFINVIGMTFGLKCTVAILSLHPEKIREWNANVSVMLAREFFRHVAFYNQISFLS